MPNNAKTLHLLLLLNSQAPLCIPGDMGFVNFPVFQENLHCLQNWDKNDLAGTLKCYPLIISQSIKISVLFHKSTYQTLPYSLKRNSGKFPSFPEKLTLCAKLGQKWSCWDFQVLPPDYVTIKISVLFHKFTY